MSILSSIVRSNIVRGRLLALVTAGLVVIAPLEVRAGTSESKGRLSAKVAAPAESKAVGADGRVQAVQLPGAHPRAMVTAAVGTLEVVVAGPAEVVDGTPVAYSLSVANDSGAEIPVVTVNISYSAGLALDVADGQGWSCDFPTPGQATCEWPVPLPTGSTTATATITFEAHPPYGGIAECDPGRSPCVFFAGSLAGAADAAARSVVVVGGNHPPIAMPDIATMGSPPVPVTIDVLANDSDQDIATGDFLTPQVAVPPTHGAAAVDPATQRIVYTPGPGFPGSDSFRYRITDSAGASATALVTIGVLPGSIAFQSPVTDVGNVEDGHVALQAAYLENTTGLALAGPATVEPVDAAEIPALLAGTGYDPAMAVSDVTVFSVIGYSLLDSPVSPILAPTRPHGPVGTVFLARVRLALSPVPDVVFEASFVLVVRCALPSEAPVRIVDDVVSTPVDTPLLIHPLLNDDSTSGVPLSVTGLAVVEPFHLTPPLTRGTVGFADSQSGGGVPYLGALFTPEPGFAGTTSFYYAASETPNGLINGRYDYAKVTVTVGGTSVNRPPVLSALANLTAPELSSASFTASASDPDGDALAFSLIGAPPGAQIDAASGVFAWIPSEAQGPGTYTFAVRVTDTGSPALSDQQTISLTVTEVNAPPVLTLPSLPAHVSPGAPFGFTATASDPDTPANTVAFTLTGAPAGASIGSSSGVFAWTPSLAQAGNTYTFTVMATDNGTPALSAQQSVTVTVDSPAPAFTLLLSGASNRSSPQALGGASVARVAYIFVSPSTGVTRVRFWLDNPARIGPPRQVENLAPFDFASTAANGSALPFDTRGLPNGAHLVSAEVTLTGGQVLQLQATFTVANTVPALLVSTSANRSLPVPLDGSVLRGNAYVFVPADPDAVRVRFWLDAPTAAPARHTESLAPFDFEGTAANGLATPFNTRTVTRGTHVIRAIIDYPGGVSLNVQGAFLVTR